MSLATKLAALFSGNGFLTLKQSQVRQATDQTASSGTVTLDYSTGDYFKVTASGNITIAISNLPSGYVASIILEAYNFGGKTITWPTGVKWAGGTAPSTLTSTGKDTILFLQDSAGVLNGYVLAKDLK